MSKSFKELVVEVAKAQSPGDKEFVALHRIAKTQRVAYPEHQFKGGTEKDHTKLTTPSDETGVETDVAKEKPLGEGFDWKDFLGEETADLQSTNKRNKDLGPDGEK